MNEQKNDSLPDKEAVKHNRKLINRLYKAKVWVYSAGLQYASDTREMAKINALIQEIDKTAKSLLMLE